MMGTPFPSGPAFQPVVRQYTPGAHISAGGQDVRSVLSEEAVLGTLQLAFDPVAPADVTTMNVHRLAHRNSRSFTLTADQWRGHASPSEVIPADQTWLYRSWTQTPYRSGGFSRVEIELVAVRV